MASATLPFETLTSSRFQYGGKDRTGKSCLCGAEVVSCAFDAANAVYLEHVLLSACRLPLG